MSDDFVFVRSNDILASAGHAAERPQRPAWVRWAAVGGAGVVVAGLAGGGFAAYGALSGGGTHAESWVPVNAAAYVELDLNPPASQKLNAVRLLHKLPKGALKSTSDDYRELLLSAAFSSDDTINYATDVDPWLGDRVGIAVLPAVHGNTPVVEAVLQVKDEAKFKAATPKLFTTSSDGTWVVRDGFAILSDAPASDPLDDATHLADSAAKAALSSDPGYSNDTAGLGDRVVTGWYDASRIAAMLPAASLTPSVTKGLVGRGTFAVHVESNAIELTANSTGGTVAATGKAALLGKLPSSTVAAVEFTGGGAGVMSQWSQALQSLKSLPSASAGGVGGLGALGGLGGMDPQALLDGIAKQYDLKLPDDLATLLGTDAAVALSGGTTPSVGYVALTDPAKAKDLVDRVGGQLSLLGVPAPAATDNGLVWGTSPTWAKDAQSGDLGSSSLFTQALPDYASARVAVYVDLAGLSKLDSGGMLGGGAALGLADSAAQAVGITATSEGTTSHIRVRLIVK